MTILIREYNSIIGTLQNVDVFQNPNEKHQHLKKIFTLNTLENLKCQK